MVQTRIERFWGLAKSFKDAWTFGVWLWTLLGLSGFVIYLATITEWARAAGPLGWALMAILTVFVVCAGYALFWYAVKTHAFARYMKLKVESSSVNVLAPVHQHERINAMDFYHPFHRPTEDARFEDCEILGPASVWFKGCIFNVGQFNDCDVVIVRDDRPVSGLTAFHRCAFLRCHFFRLTLFMNYESFQQMKQAVPHFTIISDGRIGDV
jgi:hypothetical protein